jgi:hypothetical protein
MAKENAVRVRMTDDFIAWLQNYADTHSEGNLSQAVRMMLAEKYRLLSSDTGVLGDKDDLQKQTLSTV